MVDVVVVGVVEFKLFVKRVRGIMQHVNGLRQLTSVLKVVSEVSKSNVHSRVLA